MDVRPTAHNLPALVCLMSPDNQSIDRYYVMPKIEALAKMTLTPKDPWFQSGIRIESLSAVHSALIEVKEWIPLGTVYRGFSNAYTHLMGPRNRTRVHDEERRWAEASKSATTRVKKNISWLSPGHRH